MNARVAVTVATFVAAVASPREGFSDDVTIQNVYDAFGGKKGATQDWGFSAVVGYRGKVVLFDSGTNAGIFQKNLAALGVDPRKIDVAIGSHNHHDHIAGFDYLLKVNPKVTIYLPHDFVLGAPVAFAIGGTDTSAAAALAPEQRYFNGKPPTGVRSTGRFWGANVQWVDKTTPIADGITLVATRSEFMGTFSAYPPHDKKPNLVPMPELSASFATSAGQVLLVGCSHSSVEVIIKEAAAATQSAVRLVAGGYHLLPYDAPYITGLATRLRDTYKVAQIAPAHCTGHLAFKLLRELYGDEYRFFGLGTILRL